MTSPGPRLGVDGQRLTEPVAGVSRYLAEVLAQWARLEVPFSKVVVYCSREPIGLPEEHPFEVRVLPERIDPGLWTHWTLGRAASREVDILFCPSYVAPLSYGGPFVVTIHDALPAFMPAGNPSLRRLARIAGVRRTAGRARLVLTDAESTRRDIERFYRVPGERVRVIPLAADERLAQPPVPDEVRSARERYGLADEPFVLFVGKLARRRNLPVLTEAFSDARERVGSSHRLVVVGGDTLGIGAELAALGPPEAVRVTGHIPDDDLRVLYHEAEILVHPSSYEGFGLPVLEAMAAGTPVITVDNSSLIEVAADAALVVPRPTREELATAMAQLIGDPARRRRLAERGRARAALFSWRRTAEETIAALAEAAPSPRTGRRRVGAKSP